MIASMRGAVRSAGSRNLGQCGLCWVASTKAGCRGLGSGGFSFLTTRLRRFGQPAFTSLASLGGLPLMLHDSPRAGPGDPTSSHVNWRVLCVT